MIPTLLALAVLPTGGLVPESPSADAVLGEAKLQAKREGKRIFLIFGATWCGPCHLSEAYIRTGPIAAIWKRHFVIAKVSGFKKKPTDAENPGAEALMVRYFGSRQRLPSYAILNETGKLLSDLEWKRPSPDGKTDGFPLDIPPGKAAAGEFLKILHATTPKIAMDDLRTLRKIFDRDEDAMEGGTN